MYIMLATNVTPINLIFKDEKNIEIEGGGVRYIHKWLWR